MNDREDIQKVLSLYSEGASRQDWGQVMSAFTPDGVWAVEGAEIRLSGQEEMETGFPRVVAHLEFVSQLNSPAVIEIDGDVARARSVIHEIAKLRDSDHSLTILGVYNDELARTDEGWRIKQRTFCKTASYRTEILPA